MSQRLQAADWHLEAPGRELATYLLSEADDTVGAIMTYLALLLLLLAALRPAADRPLRRVVADPVLPVAVLAAALLAARPPRPAPPRTTVDGWQRAAAAVLGVLVGGDRRQPRRAGRLPADPARGPAGRAAGAEAPAAPGGRGRRGAARAGGARLGAARRRLDRLPRARRRRRPPCWPAFPEGLALVLAVKGVGRYPELRDSGRAGGRVADAPEEFIIGTLASMLWAAAAAGTATLLR